MIIWWGFIAVATCFEPVIGLATALALGLCLLGMWLGGKAGLK
ncbi:hypothetical protein UFOVP891_2 [uncultured Caudovirales phage]|uniref:Uncharacterized protein n=1 Tax=uncultured Caudovirales phage TaxID=2100421 RepID=A0A6J5MFJ7_9CAUD|nr:hypothetical protein UFOVP472_3 [uncultured Caudovirales phage]CAB4168898.1 hypothetical protein UFOVP891_2 [uncultured Caudovirales phage]CAB4180743.1 hypothetical protein UFOVP1053_3 [uncultured Caudovirales phage]CAB4195362.1 hypothetical protein UFOVP1297_8 [uncultured Caudovirales phage]CAB4221912.1 hypothetical protein UFOVP1647_48 [uncultured Caudovirales phage]